ncbi:MAG: carboxypeptidase regulatory-like domain-containing protein [Planctomycetota bacterium]
MATVRTPVVLVLLGAAALVGWYWPIADEAPPPAPAHPATNVPPLPTDPSTPPPAPSGRRAVPGNPDPAAGEDVAQAPAGSLTGLVCDLASRALAGAQVAVRTGAVPGTGDPTIAITDATGRWFVTDLAPGDYRVRATAAGCCPAHASAKVADAAETQVETLRLTAGTTLRGIVVDGSGTGVAGATVRAAGERAATGPDGRFEVPHVPITPGAVEVSCPGWLTWQRSDVDPARELRIVLPTGLVLTGAVHDAATGEPIETYALRAARLQPLRAQQQGTPEWQLQHRIRALQQGLAATTDPAARARDELALAELSTRLATVQGAPAPPPGVPADLPAPTLHEAGQFVVDRLDEGLYVVEVLSPEHVFARTPPFVLQRDVAQAPLRVDLVAGHAVRGGIVTPDGQAIRGATVQLLVPRAAPSDPRTSSRLRWLVGPRPPDGNLVARTTSGADGAFTLACQPPATVQVIVQHPEHTSATSPPFATTATAPLRITMLPRATLAGSVRGVPTDRASEVFVLLLGGASNLRTTGIDADGNYRFAGLAPGEYLVRAGLGDRERFAADFLRNLMTAPEPPPRDVVLQAGEQRACDLTLAVPPAGRVRGLVQRNGLPEPACRVLVDVPGASRPLTTVTDNQGNFAFAAVPAGDCTLRVQVRGSRTQELHREAIAVLANTETFVQPLLQVGELSGRVVTADDTPAAELNGEIWLLPGTKDLPASLAEHRRTHTVQQVAVRGGAFRCELATAGRSLAVVRIRNREVASAPVEVPPRATATVELPAGARR